MKVLLENEEIIRWDINMDPTEYAIKENKISVTDRLQFETIANLSKCFGKSYKNMQRSFFNIGCDYYIWCPKLAIITDGTVKSVANGWINILSDDWNTICEQNDRADIFRPASNYSTVKRITFAKSKDVLGRNTYRFIGIFEYVEAQSSESKNLYERIATEIDLTQWLI